jgi:hypothetical protein
MNSSFIVALGEHYSKSELKLQMLSRSKSKKNWTHIHSFTLGTFPKFFAKIRNCFIKLAQKKKKTKIEFIVSRT